MKKNRIANFFSYSSYKSILSFKETIIAIDKINTWTKKFFSSKYNLYSINAPELFPKSSGFNDLENSKISAKSVLLSYSSTISELSFGVRKWSLIVCENIKLNNLECLYVIGNSFKLFSDTVDGEPASAPVLCITVPLEKNEYYYECHNRLTELFYEYFLYIKNEINRAFPKLNHIIDSKLVWNTIDKLNFNSSFAFSKSIIDNFHDENDDLYIKKIPTNNNVSIFYSNDSYDYEYYAAFYKLNLYNNKILKLAEISLSCDKNNLNMQLELNKKNANLKSLTDFQELIKNSRIKKYGQILIYLDKLYLFLLKKIHAGEVIATAWDDNTYELIIKNNIKIF